MSTPDQDRVDDIGHALGVEQPPAAPLRSSEEMLEELDRATGSSSWWAQDKASKRDEP